MKPIPVAFHIGPLEIHTYGIGLAVTFWFAYRYYERRLRRGGYPTQWVAGLLVWVIVSAIVGARTLSVLTNLGFYSHNPGDIVAVWHGGLSSFGGLLFAVPTAVLVSRRLCPQLPTARALDLVGPVLAAAWSMGRLLGPQLMVAGGGHRTAQWFGMYYATQVGKRLPVPIIQALEDFAIFVVLILVERRLDRWPDRSPRTGFPGGTVIGVAMVLWGIERTTDQRLWLSYPNNLGSVLVQVAGVLLAISGVVVLSLTWRRWRAWTLAGAPGGHATTSNQVGAGESLELAEADRLSAFGGGDAEGTDVSPGGDGRPATPSNIDAQPTGSPHPPL